MDTLKQDNVNATGATAPVNNTATIKALEEQLALGRQSQNNFAKTAVSPSSGGLVSLVTGFRSRRMANKNAQLEDALMKQKEARRQKLIGFLPEDKRELASNLPLNTIEGVLKSQFESSFQRQKPLSTEGKRQADVNAGLISPTQARANQFDITPEIEGIKDLGEKSTAIQKLADTNAQAGNFKLANQQRARSRSIIKQKGLIDKDVTKLSDKVSKTGLDGLVDSLETITDIANRQKDIPGAGKGALKPAFALDMEGKQLRQATSNLRNSILKARSGGAVTTSESSRLLDELGTGIGKTDEQLRLGINNVIKAFKSKTDNIKSGIRKEALDTVLQDENNIFNRLDRLQINFNQEKENVQTQPVQENTEGKQFDITTISDDELLGGF